MKWFDIKFWTAIILTMSLLHRHVDSGPTKRTFLWLKNIRPNLLTFFLWFIYCFSKIWHGKHLHFKFSHIFPWAIFPDIWHDILGNTLSTGILGIFLNVGQDTFKKSEMYAFQNWVTLTWSLLPVDFTYSVIWLILLWVYNWLWRSYVLHLKVTQSTTTALKCYWWILLNTSLW